MNIRQNSALNQSGLVFFSVGRLLITASISFGVMGLFGLSDPDLTLVPGLCLENYPFPPDFPYQIMCTLLLPSLLLLTLPILTVVSPYFLQLLKTVLNIIFQAPTEALTIPIVLLAQRSKVLSQFSQKHGQVVRGIPHSWYQFVLVRVSIPAQTS